MANAAINMGPTTNYCESEYATTQAANVEAVKNAAERLITFAPRFWLHLTDVKAGEEFSFRIDAVHGTYSVNWGDGTPPQILHMTPATARRTFTQDGDYVIGLGGFTSAHGLLEIRSSITFENSPLRAKVTKLEGDLGAVFPTIGDGSGATLRPRFINTFRGFTGLTEIPETLFAGIERTGATMFQGTFADCTNLTSIPENLFATIKGPPQNSMFANTFNNTGITEIPENLFSSIQGLSADAMFSGTFRNAGVTGSIPENLFAGIQGPPRAHMFARTFADNPNMTGSIPENLFAGIQGSPESAVFDGTFQNTGLTGPIPENLFAGVQGPPRQNIFNSTFRDVPGLTGIIPGRLFAGIAGPPDAWMFQNTFRNSTGLTGIGDGLFDGIHGNASSWMFDGTFNGCTGLTGPSARTLINPDNPVLDTDTQEEINAKRQFVWEKFMGNNGSPWAGHSNNMYTGATGLSDFHIMSTIWR
ncbi:MAG: hypothetical protein FWE64_01485 [Alphaproteobacteria bacterium]|nr:hypothetical protein [Alphaproteobacteria bacterium]